MKGAPRKTKQEGDRNNMIYGYVRISTPSQSIERQIRNIRDYNKEAKIYVDVYTGRSLDRPEFTKLLRKLKEGDTVIFDEVSRMSRNAEEGLKLYEELFNKGITLIFLKEPYINTEVYRQELSKIISLTGNDCVDPIIEGVNTVLMNVAKKNIKIAFQNSEYEVSRLRERTSEGMMTAKLNGKQIGRAPGQKVVTKKSIKTKELILKHSKDFGGSLKNTEVAKLASVSMRTYNRYKMELLIGGQEEKEKVAVNKKKMTEREQKAAYLRKQVEISGLEKIEL